MASAVLTQTAGNLVLWCVGMDLDQTLRARPTFSQDWKQRFPKSGILERLVDETMPLESTKKLLSPDDTGWHPDAAQCISQELRTDAFIVRIPAGAR